MVRTSFPEIGAEHMLQSLTAGCGRVRSNRWRFPSAEVDPKEKLTNVRYREVRFPALTQMLSERSRITRHGFIGFMSNRKRHPRGAVRLDERDPSRALWRGGVGESVDTGWRGSGVTERALGIAETRARQEATRVVNPPAVRSAPVRWVAGQCSG